MFKGLEDEETIKLISMHPAMQQPAVIKTRSKILLILGIGVWAQVLKGRVALNKHDQFIFFWFQGWADGNKLQK